MKILIIDPSFFMRSGLIQLLTNYATQPAIYEADSFTVAENYLKADEFNIIFVEYGIT